MKKNKELRVFTEAEPPTAKHPGWVALRIKDVNKLFTETELYLFQCSIFAQSKDPFSSHAGINMKSFLKGGGIVDYKKEYCKIDFVYPLSQNEIDGIKNRAKETENHFFASEEIDLDLDYSDASILASIIQG